MISAAASSIYIKLQNKTINRHPKRHGLCKNITITISFYTHTPDINNCTKSPIYNITVLLTVIKTAPVTFFRETLFKYLLIVHKSYTRYK